MNIKSKVMTGLSWTAGASFAGQIVTWSITIIVMRILSPSDYGLLATASIFVAFLSMMASAGLGPAIIQANEIDNDKLRQLFGLIICLNLALFAGLFVASPYIASFFEEPRLANIIRVLSLQFIVNAFSTIPESLLGRQLKFKIRALVDLGSNVAGGLLTLGLALNDFGVWSLIGGSLLTVVSKAVSLNFALPSVLKPQWSVEAIGSLLAFGGNVTASRLLWFFYSQADMLVASKILGKDAVGSYSVAMHLASLPVQKISGILNQVSFPAFAQIKQDPLAVAGYTLKGVRLLSFFAFPVLWGISATARDIIQLLLGNRWESAVLPLQLLPAIMPLRMISNFLPSAIDAVGRPDISVRNLISACVVLPIGFIIGANWGIMGLCIAWLAGFPLVFMGNLVRILPALNIRAVQFIQATIHPILAAAAMYLSIAGLSLWLPPALDAWLRLIVLLPVGAVVYVACAWMIDRNGFREVLSTFRR